jgi:hypothetical protein
MNQINIQANLMIPIQIRCTLFMYGISMSMEILFFRRLKNWTVQFSVSTPCVNGSLAHVPHPIHIIAASALVLAIRT